MTAEELEALRGRLGNRLNNVLCEMKPDYDNSIVGFNEAWDVMRKFFDDEAKRINAPQPDPFMTPIDDPRMQNAIAETATVWDRDHK